MNTSPPTRRLWRRLAAGALAAVAVVSGQAYVAGPAAAGQVGVSVTIKGQGSVYVVEGSLEDGGARSCDSGPVERNTDETHCTRVRNSELGEAWVWLRAYPGRFATTGETGDWSAYGWKDCDQYRSTYGFRECGVHSGVISSDERYPTITFKDVVGPPAPAVSVAADPTSWGRFTVSTDQPSTDLCDVDGVPFDCGDNRWYGIGRHTAHASRFDVNGNRSDVAASPFTMVGTTITSGPELRTTQRTATFRLASDTARSFECSLDGGALFECATDQNPTITLTGLSDRRHDLLVTGVDNPWRQQLATPYSWTVDTAGPLTRLQVTAARPGGRTVSVWTSEEARSECRLTGPHGAGPWQSCGPTVTYDGLDDGDYTLVARSWDTLGNAGAETGPLKIRIDRSLPDTTITRTDVDANTALLAWSSSKPGSHFECRWTHPGSSTDWTFCNDEVWVDRLADGLHRVEVRAVDEAGLTDPTPAVFEWRVGAVAPGGPVTPADVTAPDTALTTGPAEGSFVISTSSTLTARSTEPGSFVCTLDGAPTPCAAGTASLAGLGAGTHRFSVSAVDAAGNRDATPATRSWTVPLTAAALKAKGFQKKSDPAAWGSTYLNAKRKGATLTASVSGARSLALIAAPARGQGKVKVLLGKRKLATVSLARGSGSTTILSLPALTTAYTGPVTIVSLSGRPVRIEGLGVAS